MQHQQQIAPFVELRAAVRGLLVYAVYMCDVSAAQAGKQASSNLILSSDL
jgi:hypothetical protein